jgi:hypothetical protein
MVSSTRMADFPSGEMTLPLTYNVVRLFKLIHLSAIEGPA